MHEKSEIEIARTEAYAEGAQAENERIKAILTSDEAKGREAVALVFACDMDMPAKSAIAALASVPVASAYKTIDQRAAGLQEVPPAFIGNSAGWPQAQQQQQQQDGWNASFEKAGKK